MKRARPYQWSVWGGNELYSPPLTRPQLHLSWVRKILFYGRCATTRTSITLLSLGEKGPYSTSQLTEEWNNYRTLSLICHQPSLSGVSTLVETPLSRSSRWTRCLKGLGTSYVRNDIWLCQTPKQFCVSRNCFLDSHVSLILKPDLFMSWMMALSFSFRVIPSPQRAFCMSLARKMDRFYYIINLVVEAESRLCTSVQRTMRQLYDVFAILLYFTLYSWHSDVDNPILGLQLVSVCQFSRWTSSPVLSSQTILLRCSALQWDSNHLYLPAILCLHWRLAGKSCHAATVHVGLSQSNFMFKWSTIIPPPSFHISGTMMKFRSDVASSFTYAAYGTLFQASGQKFVGHVQYCQVPTCFIG